MKTGEITNCKFCDVEFKVPRRGPRVYCSDYCVKEAERQKHREHKRKKRGALSREEYLEKHGFTNWTGK